MDNSEVAALGVPKKTRAKKDAVARDKKSFNISKIHRLLARYIAILVMAAGSLGYIYNQADNNYVIMGVAVIAIYALVNAALGRE